MDNEQLLCQVFRPCVYATGGRHPSEIIYTSLIPHHGPVFSLHQRLPTSSLHLSLSPELSSDGWNDLPCRTTFPAAPAPHDTSTSLLDEWWHSNCRSFRFHKGEGFYVSASSLQPADAPTSLCALPLKVAEDSEKSNCGVPNSGGSQIVTRLTIRRDSFGCQLCSIVTWSSQLLYHKGKWQKSHSGWCLFSRLQCFQTPGYFYAVLNKCWQQPEGKSFGFLNCSALQRAFRQQKVLPMNIKTDIKPQETDTLRCRTSLCVLLWLMWGRFIFN